MSQLYKNCTLNSINNGPKTIGLGQCDNIHNGPNGPINTQSNVSPSRRKIKLGKQQKTILNAMHLINEYSCDDQSTTDNCKYSHHELVMVGYIYGRYDRFTIQAADICKL